MSFQEIKDIIANDKLDVLGRSVEQQEQYDKFCIQVLRKEWCSTADYILHTKFGVPTATCEDHKKAAIKPFPEEYQTERLVLLENDFPYYFESNVLHYILWKLNGITSTSEISDAIDTLKSKYSIEDATFFINPPHLKSIPEIDHAHIVILVSAAPVK